MTREEKDTAIQKMELPPDYLDRFWPIFWGFVPVALVGFIMPLVIAIVSLTQSVALPWIFIPFCLLGVIEFSLCIYYRYTDRKLRLLVTDLDKEINEQIVMNAAEALGWQIQKSENYIAIIKPFAFGQNSYLIKVLTNDTGIYYNIRTKGTYRGRIMHAFGFETLRRFQFLQKLKHFANSQLTFK